MSSIFAGIMIPFIGTTAGAACVFFLKNALKPSVQKAFLGFASGVMVAASVWSLLIPSMDMSGHMGKLAFIPASVGFSFGNWFPASCWMRLYPHLHIDTEQPEGPKSDWKKSTMLVLAVTLHNIPEGMAVAVPLISGGMSRGRAIAVTALSGAPTIIGALLGFWLGDIGPLGLALSLCFASGAMLYVVFGEILPQAILMYRSKSPAFSVIVGMMVGILIIYL